MTDLYMSDTGNALRAAVAPAGSGLEHRVHKVGISKSEQKSRKRTPGSFRTQGA